MKDILVSVIITTYKRANMLDRAIDSVLNQTYKNIEVIVVDDNNKNSEYRKKTESLMRRYREKSNVKYIKHETNKNGAAARNTGIMNSDGEVITFLDDDDYYFENKVERQLEYLLNNDKYSAVYCGWDRDDKLVNPTLKGDLSLEILSGRNLIYTNCIMIWKECAITIGGWDENFKRNQEAVFLLRLFKNGYEIGSIPDILVKFDVSDRSNELNGIENEKQFKQFLDVHDDIIRKLDYEKKGSKKLIYMYRYRGVLLNYLKVKDFTNAIKIYFKMIKTMPIYFNCGLIKYSWRKINN
ncbi:glycosyltransferase family 2 protein [Clostridium baratii]